MAAQISHQSSPAVVLLVEDNADHAYLTKESFEDARVKVELHHVEDGAQALRFLRNLPPYEGAPRPSLVLLDINMPRVDGFEVMKEISNDERLKTLAVVILTTSADTLDVERMYRLGCRSYVAKPMDFAAFTRAIQQLANYWFELVMLPEHTPR